MKKLIFSIIILLNWQISLCQKEASNYSIAYCVHFNSYPLYNIYDGGFNFTLTHSIEFCKIKKINAESKLYFGLNYQYLSGESNVEKRQTLNCDGTELIDYNRFFQKKISFINADFKYEFKPLNKNKTFFVTVFCKPGIALMQTYVFYSPEIPCSGNVNSKDNTASFTQTSGINLSNTLFYKENILLKFNYGIAYQLIASRLQSLNGFLGLSIDF